MTKVAINGMGRIGRGAFKLIMDTPDFELVAVNDISDVEDILYLIRHDSVYGRYDRKLEVSGGEIVSEGKKIRFLNEKDPASLPWKKLGVDLVFECSGQFTKKSELQKHIDAGAGRVVLSAPPKGDDIPIIVAGVNEPNQNNLIISAASCTTNCVAPVMEILDRRIGVLKAVMTTVHAYTSSQTIVDMPDKDRRRGRAGAINFAPTSTGAARATAKALPAMENIFDGAAIRGPVPSGSIADIVVLTKRDTTPEEVNAIFQEEATGERYEGILGADSDNMVSSDIISDPRASVVDTAMTMVVGGNLLKVMSWYDNEWGYVNQMVRTAIMMTKDNRKATAK